MSKKCNFPFTFENVKKFSPVEIGGMKKCSIEDDNEGKDFGTVSSPDSRLVNCVPCKGELNKCNCY